RRIVEIDPGGEGSPVRGAATLLEGFVVANDRVLVKVRQLTMQESEGAAKWVDLRHVKGPSPLVLRSEMWEIPDGQDREALLRSLAVILARQGSFHSYKIDLAHQLPGDVELLFYNEIPPSEGAAYQAELAPIRLRCHPRSLPWRPPTKLLSSRLAREKERYDSHISHLPLWLESRRLWSVYLWDEGRFLHVLQ